MAMEATFDSRWTTTGGRHSTVGGRRLGAWRHSTFNRRLSGVGCHPAVDRRMLNVVYYSFSNATKGTFTTQEVAPKSGEVAPKVAPKSSGVAPKTSEVAPKIEEQEICKIVESVFPMLRDGIAEKCAKMYFYMKGSGGSNSAMARELGIPLRSIIRYQEILKQAHVLEHVGPTHGGTWKFLI